MSKILVVIIVLVLLLQHGLCSSRLLQRSGSKKRLNKSDFQANGGAMKLLGRGRLRNLARKAKFAGGAESLAAILDDDPDLVCSNSAAAAAAGKFGIHD